MPTTEQCLYRPGEDTLWMGLSFAALNEDQVAHQQCEVGDKVHCHLGVWWQKAGPFFWTPCFRYRQINHRVSWPRPTLALAGFTHLSGAGSVSNGVYPAIVREDISTYSIRGLPKKRRNLVRKALDHVRVRPVENIQDLLGDGLEVYRSWHQRVRWGRDKSNDGSFAFWISKVFRTTRRTILGAYSDDRLIGFMLPVAVGQVASMSFIASHTEYLNHCPNEALFHAFLCIARQTPGIQMADFGPVSRKPTLDHFKRGFGEIREFPSYTWINPLSRPFVLGWIHSRYPWLQAEPGGLTPLRLEDRTPQDNRGTSD